MNPILYIRKHVFRVKQSEFAKIAGVGQASVSRWENGGSPSQDEMRSIRAEALRRNLPWHDSFFFDVPSERSAA